jgi:hypothetical protein
MCGTGDANRGKARDVTEVIDLPKDALKGAQTVTGPRLSPFRPSLGRTRHLRKLALIVAEMQLVFVHSCFPA